jgi:hypothetical protein
VRTKTLITVNEFNHETSYIEEGDIDEYRVHWFKNIAPKIPKDECDFLMGKLTPVGR